MKDAPLAKGDIVFGDAKCAIMGPKEPGCAHKEWFDRAIVVTYILLSEFALKYAAQLFHDLKS